MNTGLLARIGVNIIVALICLIYALPNFYPEYPAVVIETKTGSFSDQQLNDIDGALKNTSLVEKVALENRIELLFASTDDQLVVRDILAAKTRKDKDVSVGINLISKTPAWLSFLGAAPMKLGLDLRGGVHFLIDVDTKALNMASLDGSIEGIKSVLIDEKLRFSSLRKQENSDGYVLTLRDANIKNQVIGTLKRRFPEITFKGQGEDKILLSKSDMGQDRIDQMAIEQAMHSLNNRVNELGVSEAVIQKQGDTQISVDLPGIQDINRAKSLIGKTATLKFQIVAVDPSASNELKKYKNGKEILLNPYVAPTGESIIFASASIQEGQPIVQIKLSSRAGRDFNQFTRPHVGRQLAVVYVESVRNPEYNPEEKNSGVSKMIHNETVISAPVIQQALGESFVINGIGDMQEAQDLALLLRAGAMAAPVDIVEETTVGPSLGEANIDKGVNSLKVGSLLVIIFMLIYYRLFGLVANCALMLNVAMILAALSILEATLTLPGIAGIVLTVGMAVDANVLINERIREELRLGQSPLQAISIGYEKAFSTIIDANITTLIVAMVLFGLGSGSVKGFAITLTIGLMASMFTSIYFTRTIIDLIYRPGKDNKLSIGI